MVLSRRNVRISTIKAFFTSIWFCWRKEYDFTNCVSNFSFSASTNGCDQGSGAGPFGFGGGVPAAAGGFGGGGVPPAATGGFGAGGVAGFGGGGVGVGGCGPGSAGFSVF